MEAAAATAARDARQECILRAGLLRKRLVYIPISIFTTWHPREKSEWIRPREDMK